MPCFFNNLEIDELIKWYPKFFIKADNGAITIWASGLMSNSCPGAVSNEMGGGGIVTHEISRFMK